MDWAVLCLIIIVLILCSARCCLSPDCSQVVYSSIPPNAINGCIANSNSTAHCCGQFSMPGWPIQWQCNRNKAPKTHPTEVHCPIQYNWKNNLLALPIQVQHQNEPDSCNHTSSVSHELNCEDRAVPEEKKAQCTENKNLSVSLSVSVIVLVLLAAEMTVILYGAVLKYRRRKLSERIDDVKVPDDGVNNSEEGSVLEALPLENLVRLKNSPARAGRFLTAKKQRDCCSEHSCLGHKQHPLSQYITFHRNRNFTQKTVVACPTLNFASHFVSGSYNQPGSDQEFCKEGVRLATYRDFPVTAPVSAMRLAQAGFYFTGERDRVKCFSCGKTHEGWQPGDRPAEIHSRISPTCHLVQGGDTSNLPLPLPVSNLPNFANPEPSMESGYGSLFPGPSTLADAVPPNVEADGQQTASQRSTMVPAVDNAQSSQLVLSTGYAYGEGNAESQPTPFATLRPSMTLTDGRRIPGATAATAGSAPIPSTSDAPESNQSSGMPVHGLSTSMSRGPPCSLPMPTHRLDLGASVYPLYSQQDARRRSFATWPTHPGLPSMDVLIQLGFFYAGYADCVRCFFCGIGLKSWETEDIPAEVHARWRPTCEYLRLVKGDEFVDAVANGGRNVAEGANRPPPGVTGQGLGTGQLQRDGPQSQQASPSNSPNQGAPPNIPDLPVVRRARERGYTNAQIAEAIDKLNTIGMRGAIDVMLVEILTNLFSGAGSNNMERNNRGRNQNSAPPLTTTTTTSTSPLPNNQGGNEVTDGRGGGGGGAGSADTCVVVVDAAPSSRDRDMQQDAAGPEENAPPGIAAAVLDGEEIEERHNALQAENARLREMRTCQHCRERPVAVIFLPCGHIVACSECAPDIRRCIRCDAMIRGTANVYFS